MKKIIFFIICLSSHALRADTEFLFLMGKKDVKEEQLRMAFKEEHLMGIEVLEKKRFLLRFEKDQNLKQLKKCLLKSKISGSLQPNLKYKLIAPISPERNISPNIKNKLMVK